MKAKDYMEQLKKIDRMMQNKIIEKNQLKEIAFGTTAHSDSERVQTFGRKQKMADAVDSFVDLQHEIDLCIEKLANTKKDIISVIEQLNTTEYDLLHKVYVQYLTLAEVACIYDKTYSWATTIHGMALKNVQKIIDTRSVLQ